MYIARLGKYLVKTIFTPRPWEETGHDPSLPAFMRQNRIDGPKVSLRLL